MKADNAVAGAAVVATPPSDYLKPVFSSNAGLPTGGGGPGAPPPGPELALAVECGPNKAWFYVGRLCQGSKGPCVLFNAAWLTPNEFQYVSGRETAKDWKRSIRHHGKSMKLLMTKGILAVQPPSCSCDVCQGHAENNNNLDVNKRAAEVAARKAAEAAAATADGSTQETARGTMGEPETMGQTSERLVDGDAAIDANSPAKESRLTNIIEAIKSKKRRDPGEGSAQKENRPNSRPSSRAGKKKHKDLTSDVVSSADENSQPASLPDPPTLGSEPATEPEKNIIQPLEPSQVPRATPERPMEVDVSKDESESVDSDGDFRPETPNDVSRTRGYIWSARKDKVTHVGDAGQRETTSPKLAIVESDGKPSCPGRTLSPSATTQNSVKSPKGDDLVPAPTSMATSVLHKVHVCDEKRSGSPGVYPQHGPISPARERCLSPRSPGSPGCPKMSASPNGQDTKPPLLSASRSITTATASITTPIVSTGSGMLTAAPPGIQRDNSAPSGKEHPEKREPLKDDSSKVYAPINWPPVATDMRGEAKPSSSAQEGQSASKEKSRSASSERRALSPGPKIATKATEMMSSPNYSDYLRHLGRVPAAPPPGVDEESYVAIMRRCYEWYELSRLYGPYGLPPSAPPPAAPTAMPRSALAPSPYDPHGCLLPSMVHPYYMHHPASAGGDPYRTALGATLPTDWPGLAALSERDREAMMLRASAEEKEASAAAAAAAGGPGLGLKRTYPGELTREEALDLSVNKKRKLAESLAARDGALLYGLHGLRPPYHLSGSGAPMYPGLGPLELAAAYPGLWGLPHSHPGASLSHPLSAAGGSPHPGLHYPHHSSASTSSCTATSTSSPASKDHLHAHAHGHRPEAASVFLDRGAEGRHVTLMTVDHLTQNAGVKLGVGPHHHPYHQHPVQAGCDVCCHCVQCHAQQVAADRKS